jgi:hypothetical protein
MMKRLKQMILAASRRLRPQGVRTVPMMVPHGAADASRDFESAFEMLQGDDRMRDLWRRESPRIPLARAS